MNLELPVNHTAEKLLLSCILQDPIEVGERVRDCFKKENPFQVGLHHKLYYTWAVAFRECPTVELLEIVEKFSNLYPTEDLSQIRDIYSASVTTALWERYLAQVRESWCRQKLQRSIMEAYDATNRGKPLDEVVSRAVSEIQGSVVTLGEDKEDSPEDAIQRALEEAKRGDLYHLSGIGDLDRDFKNCFSGGCNVIVGARPGVGKTCMGTNLAWGFAASGQKVGFISLEMTTEELIGRMIASASLCDTRDVWRGLNQAQENLVRGREEFSKLPIHWLHDPHLTIGGLKRQVRRWTTIHGIKIFILDYLQLVKPDAPSGNEYMDLKEVSRMVKIMCQELDILCINLAQLRRADPKSQDPLPRVSQLRGCGDLEQDADGILLMHAVKTEEAVKQINLGKAIDLAVHIAKNRNGPNSILHLDFHPKYTLIKSKEK